MREHVGRERAVPAPTSSRRAPRTRPATRRFAPATIPLPAADVVAMWTAPPEPATTRIVPATAPTDRPAPSPATDVPRVAAGRPRRSARAGDDLVGRPPHATRIRPARAGVIRRQTLEAAKLDTAWGLAATKSAGPDTPNPSVPSPSRRTGRRASAQDLGDTTPIAKAENKPAAMKAASSRAGFVGEKMQTWAKANWPTSETRPRRSRRGNDLQPRGRRAEEARPVDPQGRRAVRDESASDPDDGVPAHQGLRGYVCKVPTGATRPQQGATTAPGQEPGCGDVHGEEGQGDRFHRTDHGKRRLLERPRPDGCVNGKNLWNSSKGGGHVAADAYTKLAARAPDSSVSARTWPG